MREPFPTPAQTLGRDEYYRWAASQPRSRFELVGGKVVAMAPERIGHARTKARAWLALRGAIIEAGVQCEALPDGITVEIGDDTAYEPDALVSCGEPMDANAIIAPNPIIVVEVLSPSTRSVDSGTKLTDYFRVPSILHYLIIRTDRRAVVHHRRRNDGGIETGIHAAGRLMLDPPGINIEIEAFYAEG